jgi:hypothetical protein
MLGIWALAISRFLAVSPGPATLSKRSIPPNERFELLLGQPFACVGLEAEGGKEVREHHQVLELL